MQTGFRFYTVDAADCVKNAQVILYQLYYSRCTCKVQYLAKHAQNSCCRKLFYCKSVVFC